MTLKTQVLFSLFLWYDSYIILSLETLAKVWQNFTKMEKAYMDKSEMNVVPWSLFCWLSSTNCYDRFFLWGGSFCCSSTLDRGKTRPSSSLKTILINNFYKKSFAFLMKYIISFEYIFHSSSWWYRSSFNWLLSPKKEQIKNMSHLSFCTLSLITCLFLKVQEH